MIFSSFRPALLGSACIIGEEGGERKRERERERERESEEGDIYIYIYIC